MSPGLGGRLEGEGLPGHEHPSFFIKCGLYIELFSKPKGSRGRILVTLIACRGSQFATARGNEGTITVANPLHSDPGLVLT